MMLRLLLPLLLTIPFPADSAESALRVAIPADEHEAGAFADFQRVSEMLAQQPLQLSPLKLPSRRAYLMFSHGEVDCVLDFPENSAKGKKGNGYLQSPPLSQYPFYFFTLANNGEPPSSIEDAQSLVVGIPRRHEIYLAHFIKNMKTVETARSEEQLFRMLELRRIDAILAALPYMEPYREWLRFHKASPLTTATNHLICHNTETNLRLLRYVDSTSADQDGDS